MSKEAEFLQTAREIWPMYRERAGDEFHTELQSHVACVIHYAESHGIDCLQAGWRLALELAGDAPAPGEICAFGWVALATLEIQESGLEPCHSHAAIMLDDILAAGSPQRLIRREQRGENTYRNN